MENIRITGVYPIIRIDNSSDDEIVGIQLAVWDYTDKSYSHGEIKDLNIVIGTDGLKIDTMSKGKDYFLEVMSKLYDMAEVK